MAPPNHSTTLTPLRILSLDGGGIRGLSSLLILERIMEDTRKAEGLLEVPKPCDRFDLIGGTSTGGITAIMLGRLGMTVHQCILAYRKMAEKAFTPKRTTFLPVSPSGAFSAKALKNAIRDTVKEYCPAAECVERRKRGPSAASLCTHGDMQFRDPSCTATAILAITKENVAARPTLFTTYDTSTSLSDCQIWQMARATSAATTFFKPIRVGRDDIEFIDAGFGHNNPCEVLMEEAAQHFPGSARMQILSVGTGLGDVVTIGDSRRDILKALKKMATTSKHVADRLDNRFGDSGQYFRFNVEKGLKDTTLADWRKASAISAHTQNYLGDERRAISRFVDEATGPPTDPGALLEAVRTQNISLTQVLITSGLKFSIRSPEGLTTLHLCAMNNNGALAEVLIQNGADINAKDYQSRSPIELALTRDAFEVARVLVDQGAFVEGTVEILTDVARRVNASKLSDYLNSLARRLSTVEQTRFIHLAIRSGNTKLLALFFQAGFVATAPDKAGLPPLIYAITYERLPIIELLVEHDANVNEWVTVAAPEELDPSNPGLRDFQRLQEHMKLGATPLDVAARSMHSSRMTELLIKLGANPNQPHDTPNKSSVLRSTCDPLFMSVAKTLILGGANVNQRGKDGKDALYWAIQCGNTELLRFMVEHGGDIHGKYDDDTSTLLAIAKNKGHRAMVNILLNGGADPDTVVQG